MAYLVQSKRGPAKACGCRKRPPLHGLLEDIVAHKTYLGPLHCKFCHGWRAAGATADRERARAGARGPEVVVRVEQGETPDAPTGFSSKCLAPAVLGS